jgi:hypothetical protein
MREEEKTPEFDDVTKFIDTAKTGNFNPNSVNASLDSIGNGWESHFDSIGKPNECLETAQRKECVTLERGNSGNFNSLGKVMRKSDHYTVISIDMRNPTE